jgi:radical SAM protein (TIGR01212 family)
MAYINPFDYKSAYGGKRYNSYNTYLRHKYGQRVQKVTVDAGFTCPNRDGTIASGGCIYCNNESFNPGYNDPTKSVKQQIDEGTEFLRRRYGVEKFVVYFQPYSNTYASLDKLKQLYEEALSLPEVIGLTIGTRPDCVDEAKISYLESLARSCDITIEYGLESIYDESLKRINRGHDYQSYLDAIEMTKDRGIKIGTHIILGFPWENQEQWLHEADVLSEIDFDFLKIHQLHIVKNTVMAQQHDKSPFRLFTLSEYVNTVVAFLEKLHPRIIIQRLAGEAPKPMLIAPKWGKRNSEVIRFITTKLDELDTWQGKFYNRPGILNTE